MRGMSETSSPACFRRYQEVKHLLFVNPWIYDFTAYDFWLKPLGLLQIAAIVRQWTGAAVHFIDCLDRFHPGLPHKYLSKPDGRGPFPKEAVAKPEVLRFVPRKFSRYGLPISLFKEELERLPTPEGVLLTCSLTYWYPGVQMVCELIRQHYGQVPIILGGVYPTLIPEHARAESGADYVVVGPGENQILPLLREILGDRFVQERRFETLDDLPLPAYDLLRPTDTLPLLISRGCPFRCTYCASSLLWPQFETRSVATVLADIEFMVRKLNCRNLAFYDDALLINQKNHFQPLLEGIICRQLPLSFHTPNGLQVRAIEADLAQLMKQANFVSIYLSQESLNPNWLQSTSPKVSPDDLARALNYLEEAGFERQRLNVYLLAGFPGQDWSQVERDVLEVLRLGAQPRLAFFSPIPGTQEWERLIAQGKLKRDSDPLLQNKIAFLHLEDETIGLKLRRIEQLIRGREEP